MQKMKKFIVILMSALLILSCSFSSFADVNDLLIATDSNAVMTLDLDDEDYGISLTSSLGSVTNTVDLSEVFMAFYVKNPSTSQAYTCVKYGEIVDNSLHVTISPDDILDGYYIANIQFYLKGRTEDALPPSGTYDFSFDLANQFSYSMTNPILIVSKSTDNAATLNTSTSLSSYTQLSTGEAYCSGVMLELRNVDSFSVSIELSDYKSTKAEYFDGYLSVRFVPSSGTANVTAGVDTSTQDYQSDVSSSLSGLSSSVDSMTDDLSSAAENLEYISTSQNLIIQGIDNVIMHISDQLYAFWDQLYNLIHLPTMSKMDEIIDVIENMDLEIEVNLDGLKSTINQMSQDVQNKLQSVQDGINNKLQSVTDIITGGYDNSGMESDQTELDTALDSYQEAEDELLEDAKNHLSEFEFDTPLDRYMKPLEDISYFMTGIYNGLGGLNIPIQFSLTLTIALILIGYYRIKR